VTKIGRTNAPKIGDERYLVEMISNAAVQALARLHGWKGGEGVRVREYCEPKDAVAIYTAFPTLETAIVAARAHLATGEGFYGCAIINHEVYEIFPRDACAAWERKASWESQWTVDR
jgi:hypothetical protein